tara:strand:+ start:1039 stop:1998 length:960 start_codon:yes stop_codon:yes gene_type:complete
MNHLNVIKEELGLLENKLIEFISSEITLATEISEYIVASGGKRIRPTLCILTCKALSYEEENLINLSAAIELLHTATLIHDDVVDESLFRRGKQSIQSKWSDAHGVLVGDFVYSKAFQLMASLDKRELIEELARSTNRISEGEVLQLSLKSNQNFSDKDYFEVIGRKTAELFKASVVTAAIAASADEVTINSLHNFSYKLGIAFQIKDDLLDYVGNEEKIGKKLGKDYQEGKITLPIVRAIELSDKNKQVFLKESMLSGDMNKFDEVIKIILDSGALERVKEEEERYVKDCLKDLDILPENEYKDALAHITYSLIDREE